MGGVASIIGLFTDDDTGEDAARVAADANAWQGQIANEQWSRYIKTFAPLEDTLVKEVQMPVEKQPGFSRMLATINRGYGDAEAGTRRTMGGRYPSGSGLERQAVRNTRLQKTTARAGAVADANQYRLDRMFQAANVGRGLPAQAAYGAAGAATGAATLANMYNQAQQQKWANIGATAGNLGKLVYNNWDNWFGGGGGGGFEAGAYQNAASTYGGGDQAAWYS